ncbi:hypothetical protein [Candidatus Spongiihabitans sp.]|uniref:hypothetical protein n=1 Tax=Candidatus Spongiihabitans sp. TaxID=3101308 RepID=UPI003C7CF960
MTDRGVATLSPRLSPPQSRHSNASWNPVNYSSRVARHKTAAVCGGDFVAAHVSLDYRVKPDNDDGGERRCDGTTAGGILCMVIATPFHAVGTGRDLSLHPVDTADGGGQWRENDRSPSLPARHSNESWNPVKHLSRVAGHLTRRWRDVVVASPSPYVVATSSPRMFHWIIGSSPIMTMGESGGVVERRRGGILCMVTATPFHAVGTGRDLSLHPVGCRTPSAVVVCAPGR